MYTAVQMHPSPYNQQKHTYSCTAVLSSDYLLLYLRASIRHGQTHLSACLNRALLILATSYRLLACGFARQLNRDALRLPNEPRQMFGGSGGSGSRGAVPPASSPASRARLSRARPLLHCCCARRGRAGFRPKRLSVPRPRSVGVAGRNCKLIFG